MKNVAVTGVISQNRAVLNPLYLQCLQSAGGKPCIAFPQPVYELAANMDCLMVCGGKDLHPKHYGQPKICAVDIDEDTDIYELGLIKAFIAAAKPILGICRGMQSINVALGGTLFQDLPSQTGLCHSSGCENPLIHDVIINQNSFLYPLLGGTEQVNSIHHQSVHCIGKGLQVAAAARDGIIEAIQSADKRIIGVQWHPERMAQMACIFDYFISL